MRHRHHRVGRRGRLRSGPRADHHPDHLRHAGRWPEHPLAGRHPGPGSPDEQLQVVRGARICTREQAQQDHLGQPDPEDRHHHGRQIVSGHAPGAGRPRHRRAGRRRHRHPPVQNRHDLAARSGRRAQFRPGPRRDPGGRRKAPDPRVRLEGRAVQPAGRPASARGRQVRRHRRVAQQEHRRPRRLAAAGHLRAEPGADRPRHRQPHFPLLRRPPGRAARERTDRLPGSEGTGAEKRQRETQSGNRPHPVLLLGLPAQFVNESAGRLARAGRHRLPLHGAVDGPRNLDLHPHGRRGRHLGGAGAVHQ